MENSFDDNFDDNIRPPDEIKVEQLLEDTRSEYEKQIDEAMYLSFQEIKNQEELYKKYEEQLLRDYNDETNKRNEHFKKFIFDLNKLSKIDKEVKNIFNIIEPIIESYCLQYIQTCELDIETYEKIFKLLDKIRTDKSAVETLKTIIIID